MKEIKVFDDVFQFNSGSEVIPITFNQYLILGDEPLLVHTGSMNQTVELLPRIKNLLGARTLSYIFVSHFESDECGGLSLLNQHFPGAKTICSQVTARQLTGFGLANNIITKNPGEALETNDYKLKFISYPSEMHLWEGLLAIDTERGIFFSSDLFIRMGNISGDMVDSKWEDEVKSITEQQIPSSAARETLQNTLLDLPVKYVALGHGPFLRV